MSSHVASGQLGATAIYTTIHTQLSQLRNVGHFVHASLSILGASCAESGVIIGVKPEETEYLKAEVGLAPSTLAQEIVHGPLGDTRKAIGQNA